MRTNLAPPEQLRVLQIEVVPFGDSALMVHLITAGAPAAQVQADSRYLRELVLQIQPHGMVDVVAGLDSLLVEFDCLSTSHSQLSQLIQMTVATHPIGEADASNEAVRFVIPMVVTSEFAPDLTEVAEELNISPESVLDRLEESDLSIQLLASAMAPMMGTVDFPTGVSRCREPRTDVAAGSIMVAGTNAIIQPFDGPTGWKVIGRTPLIICDIHRDPPISFKPGDHVRFKIVQEADWQGLAGQFLMPRDAELRIR